MRRLALAGGLVATAASAMALASRWPPLTLAYDNQGAIFPMALEAWRRVGEGRWPEWTDLCWGGMPLVGSGTGGALYPLHLVAFGLTSAPHLRAFDVALALHAGLLVSGTIVLLRTLGTSAVPAVVAGVLAWWSPFVVSTAIAWLPAYLAAAWWPWVFTAAEHLALKPRAGAWLWLGWIALAAQVWAGFPEFAFYTGLGAAFWIGLRPGEAGAGQRAIRVALVAGGAVALAAPVALPIAAQAREAGRAAGIVDVGIVHLPPRALAGMLLPVGVTVLLPSFIGLAALAVAAVGARRVPLLAAFVGFSLLMAFGITTPVYGIVHALPGFDRFRSPVKFVMIVEIGVAWLVGLGLERLLPSARRRGAVVVAFCLVGAVLLERGVGAGRQLPAIVATAAEHTALDDVRAAVAASPITQATTGKPPPRIVGEGWLVGCLPAIDGVANLYGGQVPFVSWRQDELRRTRRNAFPSTLEALGVQGRIRACRAGEASGGRALCVSATARPRPMYEVTTGWRRVDADAAMLTALTEAPRGPVPVVASAEALAGMRPGRTRGRALLDGYRPGDVRLRTVSSRPALLIVRHKLAPGWSATVDGVPTPLLPAAGIYMAMRVPGGVHDVRLQYAEPGLRSGLALAGGWVIAAALAGCWRRRVRSPGGR
jgi:hypothetical protein